MEKQYWCCIHANEDQTQIAEEDSRLRDFLNQHQVSKITGSQGIVSQASRGFLAHQAERALLFCDFRYNKFTNLSNKTDYRFAIYGMKGVHDLSRRTSYTNFYFSDEADLLGTNFFQYVFGSAYLTEREARTDSVKAVLEKKAAACGEDAVNLQILERDRELVCRIVERLWSIQLQDSAARLVLCMQGDAIQERSVLLLRQVYMLLPQKLRLNMGFATSSTFGDIKTLTEDCDLPVHVFTMAVDDVQEARKELAGMDFKYPVVLFDTEKPEEETCDTEKLEILRSLSRRVSQITDAKTAYAEKTVLKEKKGLVSFKNMEKTLEKVSGGAFGWWERNDLDKIEDVCRLYADQKEMMEVDILRQEALTAFYIRLLPWKDYAKQIARLVYDGGNQELLDFFKTELQFAKVIEAMEELKGNVEQKAAAEQTAAVAAVEAAWKKDAEQKEKKHREELEGKAAEYAALKEESIRKTGQYEEKLSSQKDSFEKEIKTLEKEARAALEKEARKHQKELEEARASGRKELEGAKASYQTQLESERTQSNQKLQRLQDKIEELNHTDTRRMISSLQADLDKEQKRQKELQEDVERTARGKKTFLITTVAAGVLAVIFLIFAVVFLLKSIEGSKTQQENNQMQTEMSALESERGELQSAKEELEGKVSGLESEKAALESEKGFMESEKNRLESEKNALESEMAEQETEPVSSEAGTEMQATGWGAGSGESVPGVGSDGAQNE